MLLETDFLVALLRKDNMAVNKLRQLSVGPEVLRTSHINVCELYKGAYISKNTGESVRGIEELLDCLEILPFDIGVDRQFGRLWAQLQQQGEQIGEMDTLIASIALVHKETILTRNIKHYEKTGVGIENW